MKQVRNVLRAACFVLAACGGLGAWGATEYTGDYASWSYTTMYAWRQSSSGSFSSSNSMAPISAAGTIGTAAKQTWNYWCETQSQYSAPGYAILFDDSTYSASVDPDFSPLSVGGLWVKTAAVFGANQTVRGYQFGDITGAKATYFKIDADVSVKGNKNSDTERDGFLGDVTLEIAENVTFDMNSSSTTTSGSKLFTSNPKNTATSIATILRMKGEGALKVDTLTASGATLDYSALSARTNTDPFITGNLTIDASTTIKLPAGTEATTGYKLCSGTLTAGTTANIVVGETTYEGVTIAVSEGTLTWTEPTEFSASITADTAWNDLEWSATLPTDLSSCELTITGSGTVTGPTSLTVRSLTIGEGVTFNGTVNGTLDGAGTLALSSLVAPTIASTWTGTVVLPSSLTSGTDIGAYGNANSTIKLGASFSGYFSAGMTISGTFDLGGFTWDITNGYSENFYTINKLVGTGTIKSTWNGSGCQPIKINDQTGFTGTFETSDCYSINPVAKRTWSSGNVKYQRYYLTIAAAITAAGDDNLTQILIVDTTAEVPTGYFISDTSIAKCAAKIDETYYNTITAAFAAAANGDEVTVAVSTTEAISAVPAGVTLTVPAGITLTLGGTEGGNTVVRVNEGATINVKGTLDYGYTRLDNVAAYTMNVYAGATLQGTGNAESGCTACGPDFADAAVTVNVLASDDADTTTATWSVATRVRTASTINIADGITLNMSGNLVTASWANAATITKAGTGTLNFTGSNVAGGSFTLTAGTIKSTNSLTVSTTEDGYFVASSTEDSVNIYTLAKIVAKIGDACYSSIEAAITAAGDDVSTITIVDSSATIPDGYASAGADGIRKIGGKVYYKSGDITTSVTVYADSDLTKATSYVPASDTLVFTADCEVYTEQDMGAVKYEVADGVTLSVGHNNNDAHSLYNIVNDSVITLGTDAKMLLQYWGNDAVQGTARLGNVTINGGTWGYKSSRSNAPVCGAITGTSVLSLADGESVTVTSIATEPQASGTDSKIVKTTNDDGTFTYSAKAITYATLTITEVDNCTITVKNGETEVESGAKFDVDDAVVLTVTRTAADGYELDGCDASETITMTADKTVTAAVVASGASITGSSAVVGCDYTNAVVSVTVSGVSGEKTVTVTAKDSSGATYTGTATVSEDGTVAVTVSGLDARTVYDYTVTIDSASATGSFATTSSTGDGETWFSSTVTDGETNTVNGTWSDGTFTIADAKASADSLVTVVKTVSFSAATEAATLQTMSESTDDIPADAQGVITIGSDSDALGFYTLVKSGSTRAFSKLSGVTPQLDTTYVIKTEFDYANDAKVRYSVSTDSGSAFTVLTLDGAEWIANTKSFGESDAKTLGAVTLVGDGTVSSMVGTYLESYVCGYQVYDNQQLVEEPRFRTLAEAFAAAAADTRVTISKANPIFLTHDTTFTPTAAGSYVIRKAGYTLTVNANGFSFSESVENNITTITVTAKGETYYWVGWAGSDWTANYNWVSESGDYFSYPKATGDIACFDAALYTAGEFEMADSISVTLDPSVVGPVLTIKDIVLSSGQSVTITGASAAYKAANSADQLLQVTGDGDDPTIAAGATLTLNDIVFVAGTLASGTTKKGSYCVNVAGKLVVGSDATLVSSPKFVSGGEIENNGRIEAYDTIDIVSGAKATLNDGSKIVFDTDFLDSDVGSFMQIADGATLTLPTVCSLNFILKNNCNTVGDTSSGRTAYKAGDVVNICKDMGSEKIAAVKDLCVVTDYSGAPDAAAKVDFSPVFSGSDGDLIVTFTADTPIYYCPLDGTTESEMIPVDATWLAGYYGSEEAIPDDIATIKTALTTANSYGISPIAAYALGFSATEAATAKIELGLTSTPESDASDIVTLTIPGLTKRSGSGARVRYSLKTSTDNSTWTDGEVQEYSDKAVFLLGDLTESSRVKYIKLKAHITADRTVYGE